MPQLTVNTNESSGTGGIPTGTGIAFIAGLFDAGPPPGGPLYVKCTSMTDVVNNFGPRSAVSAPYYDWLNEFFEDGGQVAYVTRVTDATATTASLVLQDTGPHPTVNVSAETAGAEGNNTTVAVAAGSGKTFTANTTSASPNLASVSSFAAIGVGTPVTGTGIPANTYIQSVNTGAGTAVMSQNASASASGVTITPGTVTLTVTVNDSSGTQVTSETHGPYYTTAQLFADTSSTWVTFAQATGTGNTQNLPAALAATSLTGGADASDLTDNSHVAALANFPSGLGPGTVALPGKTSLTCWQGLRDHANAKNRWAVLDMTDATTSAAATAQVSTIGSGDWSRCLFIQGSVIIPPVAVGATRTVAGSAAIAALAARVATSPNQAQAPAGQKWPLEYAQGFTTFYGPVPPSSTVGGSFTSADVQTMEAAGINCFANFYGALCLFGFVSPISSTVDGIYDQATAARERMALVNDAQTVMAPFLFDPIDHKTISAMHNELATVCLNHYGADALYGDTPQEAFAVNTDDPVNTPRTAEAKQLNAQISARIPRYADNVSTTITVIPVTVSLPAAA